MHVVDMNMGPAGNTLKSVKGMALNLSITEMRLA